MSIRLVALDMDGTLLNSRKQLPADFIPWVKAHPEIRTVIASGRQYFTLRDDFPDIADKLLFAAENGGLVFDGQQLIHSNAMNSAELLPVLESLSRMPGVHPLLCGERSAYMQHDRTDVEQEAAMYYHKLKYVGALEEALQQDKIVKVAVYVDGHGTEKVLSRLHIGKNAAIRAVISGESWIDISNSSVNKGEAVRVICRRCGIERNECMAFGDYLNDYDMLLACAESYCMANGHPQLQAAAKYIAASNDDDGVMQVLRQL